MLVLAHYPIDSLAFRSYLQACATSSGFTGEINHPASSFPIIRQIIVRLRLRFRVTAASVKVSVAALAMKIHRGARPQPSHYPRN